MNNKDGDTALHLALKRGSMESFRSLSSWPRTKLDVKNREGHNVLHLAVLNRKSAVVESLLVLSPQLAATVDDEGNTALHLACMKGHEQVVRMLTRQGQCPLNAVNKKQETALMVAVRKTCPGIVEYLVGRGASFQLADKSGHAPLYAVSRQSAGMKQVQPSVEPVMHETTDYLGPQEIEELKNAVISGQNRAVRDWLEKHPGKINSRILGGQTALHLACVSNFIDIVRLLLNSHADANIADDNGDTPLRLSACRGAPEVMKLLSRSGCTMDDTNRRGWSALHFSVANKHEECVRVLLAGDCDPKLQDENGDTALHLALKEDEMKLFELLCNKSPSVLEMKNKRGWNVLHLAASNGKNIAVKSLLALSPQLVSTVDDEGNTALHLACMEGHDQVVRMLVREGKCSFNAVNKKQETALMLAVRQPHPGIVEYLVGCGASVQLADKLGDAPLHVVLLQPAGITQVQPSVAPAMRRIMDNLASQGFHVNLVQALACYLAREGAPLDRANNNGVTPLELARHFGGSTFVGILKRFSEDLSASGGPEDPCLSELSKAANKSEASKPVAAAARRAGQPAASLEPSHHDQELCRICYEVSASVKFQPCGHRVTCGDCGTRMKYCIVCQSLVVVRRTTDGTLLPSVVGASASGRLRCPK